MPKLFDAYDAPDIADHAKEIKAAGYDAAALYYFEQSAFKKQLTRSVAATLSKAGLFIVSLYENGSPTTAGYFTANRGAYDGRVAAAKAEAAGQPAATIIYPTVDYDAAHADLPAISEYFKEMRSALTAAGYTIGVYGSGLVCRTLKEQGLVTKTWLSQSHGWQGYADWIDQADIVQGHVTRLFGADADLDISALTGGGGWKIK